MIAVIGLGNLGLAIGRRLVIRGADVVGVDLAEERRAAWQAMTGLAAAASLDDVPWDSVTKVFVIVRMTDQAEQVLSALRDIDGEDELTCFVVTTLEPDFAATLGSFSTGRLRVLELPVSGGEIGAMAGNLTAMVAGPVTKDDERFLQSTVLSQLVRFDAFGQPTMAKLFNNVLGGYNARALAEMLLLGERHGLDPAQLYRVVLTSSGGSWMAGGFFEILDDMLDKDVDLLRDHLGELPVIALGPDDDLPKRLGAARALMAGDS